jgi:hypothetical protein
MQLISIWNTSAAFLFIAGASMATAPPIKTAIFATDSTMADYGRLHATLTQGSPINVRVFQNRKEAAEWLGVPPELLAAKRPDSETT